MKRTKWLAALATVPWLAVAGCSEAPQSAAATVPPGGGEGPSRTATSGAGQPSPPVNVGIQSTVPTAVTAQTGVTPVLTKNPPNSRPGTLTPGITPNYSR